MRRDGEKRKGKEAIREGVCLRVECRENERGKNQFHSKKVHVKDLKKREYEREKRRRREKIICGERRRVVN